MPYDDSILKGLEAGVQIPNAADVAFAVRAYETGVGESVTLPALCNYMQEAAGVSAERLGWGIRKLQETGLTWMLSRLRVSVSRYAPQHAAVTVRTWPSGMKGRLVAKRCFLGLDENGGELFRASSEWLYVNLASQKIERLPENFADLVPQGTPDLELPDIGGKFAHLPSVDGSADVIARRSDLDFNDHVNNVHYVEWMMEVGGGRGATALPGDGHAGGGGRGATALPGDGHAGGGGHAGRVTLPAEIDIVFRQAAKAGDALVSERCAADGGRTLHAIRRPSDNAILATAAMKGV